MSNNFGPDTPITRREMAVIINRIMGLVEASEKDQGIQLSFKDDKDIPAWVKGYIYHAAEADIIKGILTVPSVIITQQVGQKP